MAFVVGSLVLAVKIQHVTVCPDYFYEGPDMLYIDPTSVFIKMVRTNSKCYLE